MDIAKPDESLFTYLDCLEKSFADYQSRVPSADARTTFDQFSFHTPFGGLVQAGHRNLLRSAGMSLADVAVDFERRVEPSLRYPSRTGNLCSASVYLGLESLIDAVELRSPARVGMYSYGSGCCAEFFSGTVQPSAREQLGSKTQSALHHRHQLTWHDYCDLLHMTHSVLEPVEDRQVELSHTELLAAGPTTHPFLAWVRTENYQRKYEWIQPERGRDGK